jgi:hypothetical protein
MLKVIILIISSGNVPVFGDMKRLSNMYLSLSKYEGKLKHFYLEFDSNQQEDIREDGNHILIRGEENPTPGMYQKTMKAIEHVSRNYSYEFILRTNLSSFWHIPNLLAFLETIPKHGYAGGYSYPGFISGTGIFLSKDVADFLVSHPAPNPSKHFDDLLISSILKEYKIPIDDIQTYLWGFLTSYNESHQPPNCQYIRHGKFDPNIQYSDRILYFRIRNDMDRRIDIQYFKLLLGRIYGIHDV